MIKKMIEKNKEKEFGKGKFVLSLDKQKLYNFLKSQFPNDFISKTFEDFCNNLKVEYYIKEVGLVYTKDDDNGYLELAMVDDFLYITSKGKYEINNESEYVLKYQKFIANNFPEYKEICLKQILEKKRHYQKYYGETCKEAYQTYKENMQSSYDHYKEIFSEDCPISKV